MPSVDLTTPLLRIGKLGVTPNVIQEITKLLKKRKVIKIRILKSALGSHTKKEIAQQVARRTKTQVTQLRGFVFSIKKSVNR